MSSSSGRTLIVGASLGGLRTAEALRRTGYGAEIVVVGDEKRLPYNRPPLSKDFLAGRADERSVAFPLRTSIADVRWELGVPVVRALLDEGAVETADGRAIEYDDLVIATGLRARRLDVPGAELDGVFTLRGIDEAIRLRSALERAPRVVVVGAGFVGCEVAATCRSLGCAVTVVGRDELPMARALGPELGAEMMRRHEREGVRFATGREVMRVLGREAVSGVRLDDGTVLTCDLVVEAVGSRFNTEWLAGNGLETDRGVPTDSTMRVLRGAEPLHHVFAVGDIARFPNERFGVRAATVEHWNIPTETARRAAQIISASSVGPDELARAERAAFHPVPSFWSDQYDNHILAYGMPTLGEDVVLLDGDPARNCVYGFYRGASLVGVCGVGDMPAIMRYRDRVGVDRLVPRRPDAMALT